MSGHGFGGAESQLVGSRAERAAYREGFGTIAEPGRSGVSVDVLNLIGIQLRIGECFGHGLARTLAVLGRCRDMEGITAHAEADDFRVDFRPSSLCVLVLLEQHGAGTVSHDETIAILVPGTTRGLRISVALRQRFRLCEAAHAGD